MKRSENLENYLHFLNDILSSKKNKEDSLRHMKQQLCSNNSTKLDRDSNDQADIEEINIRFHHETEIKGDLIREVEECKKSIVKVELYRGFSGGTSATSSKGMNHKNYYLPRSTRWRSSHWTSIRR